MRFFHQVQLTFLGAVTGYVQGTYNNIKVFFTRLTGCYCIGIAIACSLNEGGKTKESGHMRGDTITARNNYRTGRLRARPTTHTAKDDVTTGVQPLQLAGRKDGFIYVPKTYSANSPAALVIMLHGAGGNAEHGMSLLRRYADDHNIILVAPASRAATWDVIATERFDQDVIYIDQALELAFGRYAINTTRIAVGGFSDGASYALCLGLTNGDLFTHIIAFSPGFVYTVEKHGKPTVFISHGTKDGVLPIDPCSRRIVPQLQRQGIAVRYEEFGGAHEIPTGISENAVRWFTVKE